MSLIEISRLELWLNVHILTAMRWPDWSRSIDKRIAHVSELDLKALYNPKSTYGREERGVFVIKSPMNMLRAAALIAVPAGAVGSVGLMLHAGRRNDSRILLALFALWVLSPFMALVLANLVSKLWSVHTRATLYSVMLVLTLGSLAIYGDVALGPPRAKTAFVFVVVPPASWLLTAIVVPTAALISGRRSRRGDGAPP